MTVYNDREKLDDQKVYLFNTPDHSYDWCYSARALETELRDLLVGDILEAVYINYEEFKYPLKRAENFINCDGNPRILLESGSRYIDFCVQASGIFQMRVLNRNDVDRNLYLGQNGNKQDILCDVGSVFTLKYSGKMIKDVRIDATSSPEWNPGSDFDRSKLSNPCELPENVLLIFENNVELSIQGWNDDYAIKMAQI